ncbi:MAG: YhbY family RNA-binding protein [Oceanospirillaceae bacterium]|jgi:RNA-binding protein|nr:YhbY family RNA-binding protein [Oceanospirillaceae bacterium]MBT4443964.1 YhbY family RNA-binding protein [Oceanospirillaceae bacterium]MBT6077555.1 YhbY family RNA-binding protein [Oceanospirillaceae bacterium]MBT7329993.1 YhbY family RNA-binding protein [Oceanospirillaceae bacterium]
MKLPQSQQKQLRTIGHALHPLVTVAGNGLSENVMAEIARALFDHELIKVKFSVGDRAVKSALIADMLKQSGSTLVQSIGNVALIYLRNPDADPKKSNLER